MKKLLILLFFAPYFVSAQCKYTQVKSDDGTKTKIQETSLILLYKDIVSGDSKGFTIRQVDSAYYIEIRVSESVIKPMVVMETDQLTIKLSNNETITFNPIRSYTSETTVNSTGTHTILTARYSADRSKIEALSKYGIVQWKFTYIDGAEEETVKEKWQTRLNEPAQCILTK
jgi:hypothetical protein